MADREEMKALNTIVEGLDILIHRVTWLQYLVIVLMGINIVLTVWILVP